MQKRPPSAGRLALLLGMLAAAVASCGDRPPSPPPVTRDGGAAQDGGGQAADGGTSASDGGGSPDAGLPPDAGSAPRDPASLPESSTLFPLGVQAGDPTTASALLWTRYQGSRPLRARVFEDAAPDGGTLQAILDFAVSPAEGGYVRAEIGGLRSEALYGYVFFEEEDADGGMPSRSALGRFRTAPWPDVAGRVRFGATSCTKRTEAPFAPLSRAAEIDLDFFLLLGDTPYNDGASSREEYRALWAEHLGARGYRDLLPRVAHYATWDDHEVEDNWDPERIDPARLETAREAFFENISLRRLPPPNENRVWRSFRWGRTLEIFILDCRSERRPSTRDRPDAQYISRAQLDWLKAGLIASTAAFKIIANSVPIANFPGVFDLQASDRWEGYPAQRAELLDFLTGQAVRGVVFVSGDFHLATVAHLEETGPRSAYLEVLAGPGGHTPNPLGLVLGEPQFEFGSLTNNVVIFDADTTVDPPSLRMRFLDGEGQVFFDKTIQP